MAWGTRVHEALEAYIGRGEPLPDGLMHHAPLYEFPPVGYTIMAEVKLGILRDGSPCDFFHPDVFARGVLDVIVLCDRREDMAMLIDHKTGKVREDPSELLFHAMLLNAHHGRLRTIKGWYNWLAIGQMGRVHDLSDTEQTYNDVLWTQERLEQEFKLGPEAFPPRQGPLCAWCPVNHCEFHP